MMQALRKSRRTLRNLAGATGELRRGSVNGSLRWRRRGHYERVRRVVCSSAIGRGGSACHAWPISRIELETTLVLAGPAALARLREAGDDPVRRPEVRRNDREQTSRRNLERAAWEREHGTLDPEIFTTKILPALASVSVAAMAEATGLSRNYCATIRAGKHVPHARHFEALLRISEP